MRSQGPCCACPEPVPISASVRPQGRVCGLCGNFDDNALNDFTTRSQSVVGDALEFGNSWKFSPSCPDAQAPKDPCAANPYRKSWAQKQCSIVNSATFSACHAHVRGVFLQAPGEEGTEMGAVALCHPLGPAVAMRTRLAGLVGQRAPGETGPGRHQAALIPRSPQGWRVPRCLKPLSPVGGVGQVLRGLRERRVRLRLGG